MPQDSRPEIFDAIVVGSGATGGWAAKQLAEAGLKVGQFSRSCMIDAEFVNGCGGCRIGVALPRSGPK